MSTTNDKIVANSDILVVDDNAANLKLLVSLLSEAGYRVRPANDGGLALRSVQTKLPTLILLDVRMPDIDGYEICRRLKADKRTSAIPIMFITVLDDDSEKVRGFAAGCVDYVTKPIHKEELLARVYAHTTLRLAQLDMEDHNAKLTELNTKLETEITEREKTEEALTASEKKYRDALQSVIVAMSKFNESRDPYTTSHEHRVTELACAIAAGIGFPQQQIEGIRLSSYIHDSGKLAVPLEILMYRGKLTEMQMSLVRAHPQNAYNILVDIDFPWPIAITVWQHHERLDRSGYPQGLRGGDIIPEARILAVADVVEAMASARPYRPPLGIDKALEEISNARGKLYDPAVVDACLKLFQKEGFKFTEPGMQDVF